MTGNTRSQAGLSKWTTAIVLSLVALGVALAIFARPLRQRIRESFMQRVTTAHYEILSPPGTLSPETMRQFATQRESLFNLLDQKLDDAGSNAEIRIVFYADSPAPMATTSTQRPYTVTGTTIRTEVNGLTPKLDPAADAGALLHVAWGDPGNAEIGRWAATWLVGEWRGEEIGMAAAAVEQRLGHRTLSALLDSSSKTIPSAEDRTLLGAAWISEVAELNGPSEVRTLYSARMPSLNPADVAKTMATAPLELERRWQMWMYAYLAGMPSGSQSMPPNMKMPGQ